MINMPWYMSPDITCKVLNRIANRHPVTDLQSLVSNLDYATELLWQKQEQFYQRETKAKNQDVTP
jgi:hypothetical protein